MPPCWPVAVPTTPVQVPKHAHRPPIRFGDTPNMLAAGATYAGLLHAATTPSTAASVGDTQPNTSTTFTVWHTPWEPKDSPESMPYGAIN
jgi:hypothetical protein